MLIGELPSDLDGIDGGIDLMRQQRGDIGLNRSLSQGPHPVLAPPFGERHLPDQPLRNRGRAGHRQQLAFEPRHIDDRRVRGHDDRNGPRLRRKGRDTQNRRALDRESEVRPRGEAEIERAGRQPLLQLVAVAEIADVGIDAVFGKDAFGLAHIDRQKGPERAQRLADMHHVGRLRR